MEPASNDSNDESSVGSATEAPVSSTPPPEDGAASEAATEDAEDATVDPEKEKRGSPSRKPLAKPLKRATTAQPSAEPVVDVEPVTGRSESDESKSSTASKEAVDTQPGGGDRADNASAQYAVEASEGGGGADLTGSEESKRDGPRLERTASVVARESEFDKLKANVKTLVGDKYAIDTGVSRDPASHFLSWEYMNYIKRQSRPGHFAVGTDGQKDWKSYDVCMDMGQHVPCTKKRADASEEIRNCAIPCWKDTNALADYGLGVSLYFKYLKFMMIMMFVITIVNVPGMMFWYLGSADATGWQVSDAMVSKFNLDAVAGGADFSGFFGFYTGVGSWGDGATQCYTGLEQGDEVSIDCGEKGGSITSVVAFYGEPKGVCSCPVENRVDADTGLCPDGLKGPKQMTYGGNDLLGDSSMCCYEDSLAEDGLNIRNQDDCFSSTAKYIAAGLCKNRHSCSFTVDYDQKYEWGNNYNCDPYTESTASTGKRCKRSFLYDKNGKRSDFSNCQGTCSWSTDDGGLWSCDSYDDMELMIVATCEKKRIYSFARQGASAMASSFDALAMLILWGMLVWLEIKQREADKEQNLDVCSPGDYTVLIAGLPKANNDEVLKNDLRAHFQRVIEAEKPTGKKGFEKRVTNHVVTDINFAYSNAGLIHNKILLGKFARQIDNAIAKRGLYMLFKFEKQKGRIGGDDGKVADCFEKRKLARVKVMDAHIKTLETAIGNLSYRIQKQEKEQHTKRPIYAYVTFNSEEAYMRCRNAYPNLGKLVSFFQRSSKRLYKAKGDEEGAAALEPYPDALSSCLPECFKCVIGEGYRLRVIEATEPEDVIWEHLGYSDFSRLVRKVLSDAIIIGFIAISFGVILYGSIKTAEQEAKFPTGTCSAYTEYAFGDRSDNTYFGQETFGSSHETAYYGYTAGTTSRLTVQDVIKDYETELYTDDGVTGNSGLLDCMCKFLTSNLDSNPVKSLQAALRYKFYKDLDPGDGNGVGASSEVEYYCRKHFKASLIKGSITNSIVVIIAVINIAIEYVAKYCAHLERHRTYSAELTSIVQKQFIATFLNTAVIILVINGSLRQVLPTTWQEFLETLTVDEGGVNGRPLFFGGEHQDIDSNWFSTVGVALFATLFSQSVISPLSNMGDYFQVRVLRWLDRSCIFSTNPKMIDPDTGKHFPDGRRGHVTHQVTQDALNRMYMGGEFKLTKRYAQQMALFFSLLLFSAALPGLYVFGLLAFVIYFTVDKFLFTRFYRTPEKFDASLAVMAVKALPYAIFLHLSMSLWVFSNAHIFHETDDDFGIASNSTTASGLASATSTASSFTQDYGDEASMAGHELFRDNKQFQRSFLPFCVWLISLVHLLYRDFWIPFIVEVGHILIPMVAMVGACFPCCHLERCVDPGVEPENNPPYVQAISTEKLEVSFFCYFFNRMIS